MRDNKYGISYNTDDDERAALLQPKFTSRFRVLFPNIGESNPTSDDGITEESRLYLSSQVEKFTRPTFSFNNKPVYSFLGKGFISGKVDVGEVSFTIRDDILNAGISFVYRQLQHQINTLYPQMRGYGVEGNLVKYDLHGTDMKFNMILEVLDGRTNNAPLEIWECYGCLVNTLTPSGYSYEDDAEIATIDVSCTVDAVSVHRPERLLYGDREYDEFGEQHPYNQRDIFIYSENADSMGSGGDVNASNGIMDTIRGMV